MKRPTIAELVSGMGDVATLPVTVVELLYLLDDDTASAQSVQKVLERDVAMTANILKLGNSAYYGSRRKISSVCEAIVLLGNRSVATLAFAAGMAPVLRRDLTSYNLGRDEFWEHAMISAAASSLAADQMGLNDRRCEIFTVGLVHDVGMLIIDRWLVEQGITLAAASPQQCDFLAAEREVLGFDHAQVGASLAQRWGFPDLFTQVIALHHNPDLDTTNHTQEIRNMSRAVAAGNLMAGLIAKEMVLVGEMESSVPSVGDSHDRVMAQLQNLGIDLASIEQLRLDLTENLEETLTSATRCGGSRS